MTCQAAQDILERGGSRGSKQELITTLLTGDDGASTRGISGKTNQQLDSGQVIEGVVQKDLLTDAMWGVKKIEK